MRADGSDWWADAASPPVELRRQHILNQTITFRLSVKTGSCDPRALLPSAARMNPSVLKWLRGPSLEKLERGAALGFWLNSVWPLSMSAFRRNRNSKPPAESVHGALQLVSPASLSLIFLSSWLETAAMVPGKVRRSRPSWRPDNDDSYHSMHKWPMRCAVRVLGVVFQLFNLTVRCAWGLCAGHASCFSIPYLPFPIYRLAVNHSCCPGCHDVNISAQWYL